MVLMFRVSFSKFPNYSFFAFNFFKISLKRCVLFFPFHHEYDTTQFQLINHQNGFVMSSLFKFVHYFSIFSTSCCAKQLIFFWQLLNSLQAKAYVLYFFHYFSCALFSLSGPTHDAFWAGQCYLSLNCPGTDSFLWNNSICFLSFHPVTTQRPTDGVDVYFEKPVDDTEHANFLRAKTDLEERRMKRINEVTFTGLTSG